MARISATRATALLVSALCASGVLAGCSTSTAAPTIPPSDHVTATTTLLPLGHAKASVVPGLPVPIEAELIHDGPGQTALYGLPDVPISSANKWYEAELPSGHRWKDWRWSSLTGPGCPNLHLFHPQGIDRTWAKGNSILMLGTTESAAGTGIVIEVLPEGDKGFPLC
jgi:hypothetical protein